MELRQWCLEFGISQEFDADDAVELIKAYESLYVPIHGRASIEQQVQPDSADDYTIPIPLSGKMVFKLGSPRRLT